MKLKQDEIFYIIKCVEADYARNEVVLKSKDKKYIKNIIKKLQKEYRDNQ